MAADDDRHARPLHGLRIRLERRPAEVLPGERLGRLLPERAQRAHRLGRARGAVLERDAERLELLAQPADADAEDHPPVRQHVERRDLLGDVDRMALRQEQYARREAELFRHGGREGEGQKRVQERDVLRTGDLARRAVGIHRAVPDRDDDVLDRPERFDADVLGRTRQVGEVVGEAERAGVGVHEAEFHGRGDSRVRTPRQGWWCGVPAGHRKRRARHSEAWRLCAGLTCPPIGEQRLRPLDAVRVVLPPGDLERALGLGVRLVLRAPRPERPREVEARAEVVRVDFQRAAELPLGVLRVAAEQARRVEEQRALSGERISEVRRQLEGAIDLAPQPAKLGQRADAGPRAPHLTAEAAEDREVGERVAVVGGDRPLGLRERAVEQCRTLALGSVVGAVTQLERLARCRCARRIGGASHAHREAEQRDQTAHAATLAGAAGAANATGR